MPFTVLLGKIEEVQKCAEYQLKQVRLGRWRVHFYALRSFCKTYIYLKLDLSCVRFFTRNIFGIRDLPNQRTRGQTQAVLAVYSRPPVLEKVSGQEMSGRRIVPLPPNSAIYTGAAQMGHGGTMKDRDLLARSFGIWSDQVVWNWKDQTKLIKFQKRRAIRKVLQGHIGKEVKARGL